jgi:hypothetical protein
MTVSRRQASNGRIFTTTKGIEGPMENRIEALISRRDAAIAAIIAALFGAGIALVGSGFFSLVLKDLGSLADWVAALGTWAIGIGAIYYAYQAHFQRLDEVSRAMRRQEELEETHRAAATLAVLDAATMSGGLSDFVNAAAEDRTLFLLEAALDDVDNDAYQVVLPAEIVAVISTDALAQLKHVNLGTRTMRWLSSTTRGALDRFRDQGSMALLGDRELRLAEAMLSRAAKLEDDCARFVALVSLGPSASPADVDSYIEASRTAIEAKSGS